MSTFKIPYYTCQVTLHKKISSLNICYTPEFSHSAIFRFLFFCSSHFPHCAFSTLRTFHIFTFSTLLIFHTPRLLHFALSKLRVFYLITWNFRDTLISIWFLMGKNGKRECTTIVIINLYLFVIKIRKIKNLK